MGVVITFSKKPTFIPNHIFAQSGEEFLEECKRTLEYEDYRDVLCGIMDQDIYEALEPEIQDIVNQYYSCE